MKFTLQILLACLLVCPAFGATVYVSTTGNDSTGTGTLDKPFRTIKKGLEVMKGGDTLLLRGGVYEEDRIDGTLLKSGTSGLRTVIASYPGERAIFRPERGHGINGQNRGSPHNYFVFDGFTIDMSRKENMDDSLATVKFADVNHVTFTNMHFINNTNGTHLQIYPPGDGVWGQGLHVVDCVFSNNFIVARSDGTMPSAVHPFYTRFLPGTVIERNRLYNGHSTGIMTTSFQTNWVVRGNYLSNYSHGLHWRGWNSIAHNNVFVDCGRGIRGRGNGNTYANNTVVGFSGQSQHGVEDHYDGAGSVDGISRDEVFINNVAYGHFSGSALISRDGAGQNRRSYFTNNIGVNLASTSGSRQASFLSGTIHVGTMAGREFDPLFISPSDLRLRPGSPAAGGGVNLKNLFVTDHAGLVRGNPWSIGAHTYNVELDPIDPVDPDPDPVDPVDPIDPEDPEPDPDPDPEPPKPPKKVPPGQLKIRAQVKTAEDEWTAMEIQVDLGDIWTELLRSMLSEQIRE